MNFKHCPEKFSARHDNFSVGMDAEACFRMLDA
jgi:hypothetical protein